MPQVEITQVASKGERDVFIKFPWRIYQGDPAWVPPLLLERKEFLDQRKHPFFDHGAAALRQVRLPQLAEEVAQSVFTDLAHHARRLAPDTILYGAAYYHEYMPYERLDKDVELMKRAAISVVRAPWSA